MSRPFNLGVAARCFTRPFSVVAFAFVLAAGPTAAALFEDDEARRAILDLRQRVEAQRLQTERQTNEQLRRGAEENAQLRRSLLELQQQLEALRGDLARLRGSDEQFARELADVQRRQRDVAQGVDERLRRFEPVKVSLDGRDFTADPAEQRAYEAALALFRNGDYAGAQPAFNELMRRWPTSGYRPASLFWTGNAQYALRDYRGAITSFRGLLQAVPDHSRAPEAVLSIANCQIELKETPAARTTLDDLIKAYPQSEAAVAARERLAALPAPRASTGGGGGGSTRRP